MTYTVLIGRLSLYTTITPITLPISQVYKRLRQIQKSELFYMHAPSSKLLNSHNTLLLLSDLFTCLKLVDELKINSSPSLIVFIITQPTQYIPQ